MTVALADEDAQHDQCVAVDEESATGGARFEADLLAACMEAEGAYTAQIDTEREAAAIDQAALEDLIAELKKMGTFWSDASVNRGALDWRRS